MQVWLKRMVFMGGMVVFCSTMAWAQNGVYVSGQTRQKAAKSSDDKIRTTLEPFVRQVVINEVLITVGEVLDRVVARQETPLLPAMRMQVTQKSAVEIFKYPELETMTRDAYNNALDAGVDAHKRQLSQNSIRQAIQSAVEIALQELTEHEAFQEILKQLLTQGYNNQQRVMAQTMMNQRAQQTVIRAQLMQQMLSEQLQKTLAGGG